MAKSFDDLISVDFETFEFSRRRGAPRIIAGGFHYVNEDSFDIVIRNDLEPLLLEILESDRTLAFHNAAYDLSCLLATFPELAGVLYKKLDDSGIYCTMIGERLLTIAHNSGKKIPDKYFKLVSTLERREIASIEKDGDVQMSYKFVDNVPVKDWDQEYIDYLEDDVIHLENLVLKQMEEADFRHYPKFKDNVLRETAFALSLQNMSNRGVLVSSRIFNVYEDLKKTLIEQRNIAAKDGLIRPTGSKNIKAIQDLIYSELGSDAKMTTPTNGSEPQVSYGKVNIELCKSPAIASIQTMSKCQSYISTFIKPLRKGVQSSAHPKYKVLGAATGRTSSYQPNGQNIPGDTGIRECVIARPGYVFVICDFDSQEMRTLGQACLDICGHSVLAESYRKDPDFDPHSKLATNFLDYSYKEILKLKEDDDHVSAMRKQAKITNFTFPGGGGAKSFRNRAWTQYKVDISLEKAIELKKAFIEEWQLYDYFNHVKQKTRRGDPFYQLRTGMMRGEVEYTQGCNNYFQGLGAVISKTAVYFIDKACRTDTKSVLYRSFPVLFVHDEVVTEVPEDRASECAKEIKRLMEKAQSTWAPDVPPAATPAVTRHWSKKASAVIVDGEYKLWKPKRKKA